MKKKHIHETLCQISLVFHGPREYYFGKVMKKLNHIIYKIAFMVVDYCGRVYGKPGMPEQPGSAETALFLQLESRANTIMPLMVKTLQQN